MYDLHLVLLKFKPIMSLQSSLKKRTGWSGSFNVAFRIPVIQLFTKKTVDSTLLINIRKTFKCENKNNE